jgi:hypothetical protein
MGCWYANTYFFFVISSPTCFTGHRNLEQPASKRNAPRFRLLQLEAMVDGCNAGQRHDRGDYMAERTCVCMGTLYTPHTECTFTHAENATVEQRIEILNWHHSNGGNQTKTAKHFAPKYAHDLEET